MEVCTFVHALEKNWQRERRIIKDSRGATLSRTPTKGSIKKGSLQDGGFLFFIWVVLFYNIKERGTIAHQRWVQPLIRIYKQKIRLWASGKATLLRTLASH